MGRKGSQRRAKKLSEREAQRKRKQKDARRQHSPRYSAELDPAPDMVLDYNRPSIPGCHGLTFFGPVVEVVIGVPQPLVDYLRTRGQPVPVPIRGHALIDTGASQTAVVEAPCRQDLGLLPVSTATTHGAHGPQEVNIYRIEVTVPGGHRPMSAMLQAAAYPPLDLAGTYSAQGMTLIALLGRDYLEHVTFLYDGPSGRVEVYHGGAL